MSDIAIEIHNVSRSFKRYRNQRYRVMDALGLRVPADAYDEFWALKDLSVQVRRGERLGLIGRNGAGKSTLLNLVCGQLQPTAGTVNVAGRVQALMELGTGFHPEFTGRENVFSSLAYQGMTGREAQRAYEEIVDFSELQDFIAYPVKTYSAGMYARLAFATATAIVPDILIIDEVLGAGDAYFASKCADRMRRLTVETGATVLFVSHDTGSVERLCDRALWIERGRLHQEGPTLDVSKAYYASIMEQEEARLRAETSKAVSRMRRVEQAEMGASTIELLFRFVNENGAKLQAEHPVKRLQLVGPDGLALDLYPGSESDSDQSQSAHLLSDPAYMTWGPPETIEGSAARCIMNTGGQYNHAPFKMAVPDYFLDAGSTLVVEHAARAADVLAVEFYHSEGYRRLGTLTANGKWTEDRFIVAQARSEEPREESAAPSKWSTREAHYLRIEPCNAASLQPQFVFRLGEPLAFRMGVNALVDLPLFWLAVLIFDDKGNRVSLSVEEFSDGLPSGEHEVIVEFPTPTIRQGDYVVSFEMLAEFDYYWTKEGRFPHLAYWDRCVFFKVEENYKGIVDLGRVEMPMTCRIAALATGPQGNMEQIGAGMPRAMAMDNQ